MTVTSEQMEWVYFNTSNEEWEWAETRPAINDEVHSVKECTYAEFCERFPNHD